MEVDNNGFTLEPNVLSILILGNTKVGKSSIIRRNYENDFNHVYFPTEGIIQTISHIKSYGTDFKILILDVNGNLLHNPMGMQKIIPVLADVKGIFFVYDISNEKSFLDITKWLSSVENVCDTRVQKILLGNKADKDKECRTVHKELGEAFANLHQMRFLETCAISNVDTNIKSAFYIMTHDIRKAYDLEFAVRFEMEEMDSKSKKPSRRKRILKYCTNCFLPCTRKCRK